MDKDVDAFRTISEVAEDLDLPQHVLRFWELRFPQIKPMKRSGGRRYYRPEDLELLRGIKHLLYGEGYTIKGVQRIFKEQGVRVVVDAPHSSVARAPARKEPSLQKKQAPEALAAIETGNGESADRDEDEPGVVSAPASLLAPLRRDHAQRLHAALLDIEEGARILAAAQIG